MKKLWYRILTVIFAAAFFTALLTVFRTGVGAAKLAGAKLSAAGQDGISILENTAKKMAVPPLPEGKREFTYEDFDHIFINGKRYDFPLKYNELPEEFSLRFYSSKKDIEAEKAGFERYNVTFYLYYNGLCWAWGSFHSDKNEYDPDNVVIENLVFLLAEKNELLPQVIIGGLDVYDTDAVAVDRVYGYGMEEYYCSSYYAEAADKEHEYSLFIHNDEVAVFDYFESGVTKKNRSFLLTKEEYYLRDNYSPETDNENALMEYKPVPEKNGGLQLALENLTLYENKIKLPCTVNSLLYSLKDAGAYIGDLDYDGYNRHSSRKNKYEPFVVSGQLNTDDGIFSTEFLITPGKSIGEGQVISISESGRYCNHIEIAGIDKENPSESDERYGVIYSGDEQKYMITDYEYNNVFIDDDGCIKVSYWGENLTAVGEDTFFY